MKKIISLLISLFIFLSLGVAKGEVKKDNLTFNPNENYFIGGGKTSAVKAQLSVKYDLLSPYSLYGTDLFFSYKQLVLWNPYISNLHFHDINFMPQVYSEKKINKHYIDYVRLGWWEHRSNNQKELRGRSWDKSYIQAQASMDSYLIFKNIRKVNTGVNLKVFNIWHDSNKNHDIEEFVGHYESKLFIKPYKNSREELYARWGTGKKADGKYFDFTKGWYEVGLIYRAKVYKFKPLLFFQFWHGYGECSLDYNLKETKFRAGVMLI